MARAKSESVEQPTEAVDEESSEVLLVGRVGASPVTKTLPSGDVLVTFRVVIRRPPRSRGGRDGAGGHGPQVDTLDCVAWRADVRRTAARWEAGDVVELRGALRRRFWRAAGGPVSRVEVEVVHARRVRRAA